MAIVSISRIQIRRGRKNQGSGLPQLAGGELGWAVDTQELYIGNGAVSEGAPAVGNSKILTEHDNLFELSDQYTYKNGTNLQTGSSSSNPIQRSLQSRLDDFVNVRSFGANGDGTDQTLALQRAIDELYLNPFSDAMDADSLRDRVTLKLDAGLYKISNTLNIPPYVNLVGDGSDKTVIEQTGNHVGALMKTRNGTGLNSMTTSNNQTNIIKLEGMTLKTNLTNPALQLIHTKDSQFIDIKLQGPWTQGSTINATQVGLQLDAEITTAKTENNNFEKLKVVGFSYGILSNTDIESNHFEDCVFETLSYGVYFGRNLGVQGQNTGPINNTLSNSKFFNIDKESIWIAKGKGNISKGNSFRKVGNDGGLDTAPVHAIIRFDADSNISKDDFFARTEALMATNPTATIAYIPEVKGKFNSEYAFVTKFYIGYKNTADKVVRLPADTTRHYQIDYTYKSSVSDSYRSGTLEINIDKTYDTVSISDEYDYLGNSGNNELAKRLQFSLSLEDENADTVKETLYIKAKNDSYQSNENAEVIFKIRSIS